MAGEKIRVLIADDVAQTRENVQRLLLFEDDLEVVGMTGDGERAVALTQELKPDVVLMDINMPGMDGISATEAITLQHPHTAVVMMSVQGEQDYLRRAMLSGARDYLMKPFSGDELASAVRKVVQLHRQRDLPAPAGPPPLPGERPPGQVITVFSTKGGVGCTTVAANLAVIAALSRGKRVALVDLDLQFGDVAISLNLLPRRNLADAAQDFPEDMEGLGRFLTRHASGVQVLPAPAKPEYAELVSADHVRQALQMLRQQADYVFVDTPCNFQETVLAAVDESDRLVLLTTMDLPAIKNVKLCLDTLKSLHYDQELIRLVVNKAAGERQLKARDLEDALGMGVFARLPSDEQTAVAAVNKGHPLVQESPNTRLAGALRNLYHLLLEPRAQEKAGKRSTLLGSILTP